MKEKLQLVYSSTETPAHKALLGYINGKIVVPRPFNVGTSEEWTTTQQASWAILQVKQAFQNHSQGYFNDLEFSPNDKIAKSRDKDCVRLNPLDVIEPTVLKNPQLFNLAVKAFAEVAGVNPDDVTTCSVKQRGGLWGNAMNIANPAVYVATQDSEVTERLVDFARSRVLKSSIVANPLVFEPVK